MLDNMESITGTARAVGSKLGKKEQEKLITAVKCLLPSSIKILLGSRADEAWLGQHTFKDSIYVLEGLDRESRFFLAEEILKDTVIDDREEFNRLMEILAAGGSLYLTLDEFSQAVDALPDLLYGKITKG